MLKVRLDQGEGKMWRQEEELDHDFVCLSFYESAKSEHITKEAAKSFTGLKEDVE